MGIVELLLQRQDLYVKAKTWTALIWACENQHREIVHLLLQRQNINKSLLDDNYLKGLLWACEKEDVEILDLLLQRGASGNQQNQSKWKALMDVCKRGNPEIAALLLGREELNVN